MTSATLSKWVVLKGAVKRLKWMGILYLAVLILEIPLPLWMVLTREKTFQGVNWVAARALQVNLLFHPLAHLTSLAMAIVTGMILFHYLQKERENTFFHSLPIKRTMLYWQNLLAGLVLIWVPLLITAVLATSVISSFGITQVEWLNSYMYGPEIAPTPAALTPVWQIMAFWIFFNLLMTGMFLVITVGVGMLTGNAILQGALTLIGMFLPLGLYLLVNENLSRLLYGFPRANESGIEWYSPLVSYLTDINYRTLFDNAKWYGIYLAVTVALIALSIYLYKNRRAEAAGETLAADWIRWIFKYGVAFCAAITGGLYFASFNLEGRVSLYIGYAVGALMGYIVADMIAHKSFHFYRRWKGFLIFGVSLVLLVTAVKTDLIGYQKYVPEQTAVKEVVLENLLRDYSGLQQPEDNREQGITSQQNIKLIRQLHQEIISRQEENLARQESLNHPQQQGIMDQNAAAGKNLMPVNITYVLEGGSKVSRNYTIDLTQYRRFLYPLFGSEEVKRNLYSRLFQMDSSKLYEINLNNFRLGRSVRLYKPAEVKEAMEALRKDALKISYEAAVEGKVPPQASIDFVFKLASTNGYNTLNFSYFREYTNFRDFLAKHGYLDELFLDPKNVDRIEAGTVSTELNQVIRDKEQIRVLLDYCSLSDERAVSRIPDYAGKPGYAEATKTVQYFGKIYQKDGTSVFVSFEGGPDYLPIIEKILK
ncbi:MAG TPA: DUF6449 domain-containing protein [Bacillota bacterium]|nr:DUF6449 domain-containing protein [Bacillota bacterium]